MTPRLLRNVALTIAKGIVDPPSSTQAFVALALRVDEPLRSELLNKAKEEAFRVDEEQPWEQAQALASVAEHLPAKDCGPLLEALPNLLGYHGFDRLIAALARNWEAILPAPECCAGRTTRKAHSGARQLRQARADPGACCAGAGDRVNRRTGLVGKTADTIVEAGQSWP